MAFLELKNIGKIYVSEGSVGIGIRNVDLSFEKGEFVAITGKSGSGKSTLLNVISGIDSYEEGEMYIEGEPTSHFIQEDWEEYRKKYISFIFQDYNILESMTVLQNVELSLMHIEDRKERRQRALELLRRVGMENHIHHKGSHLSGGQKQRTVIARALSKDSPIILADEPTGNLDSQSSKEIIELLSEVSKDKLLIIVTHSFDEVKDYATREVRIFDGSVEEDKRLAERNTVKENTETADNALAPKKAAFSDIKNGLTLGRVRFFSKPKLSVFICFMMIIATLAVTAVSSMFGDIPEILKKDTMFYHINGRVVISRNDGKAIGEEELNDLVKSLKADSAMHYDYLLDYGNGSSNLFYSYPSIKYSYDTTVSPSVGRKPEKPGEVMLCLPLSDQPEYGKNSLIETKFYIGSMYFELVGIKYNYDNNLPVTAIFTEEGFQIATALSLYQHSSEYFNLNATIKDNMNTGFSPVTISNIAFSFALNKNEFIVSSSALDAALKECQQIKETLQAGGIEYSYETSFRLDGRVIGYPINDYYYWRDINVSGAQTLSLPLSEDRYQRVEDPERVKEILAESRQTAGFSVVLSPYIIEDFMEECYYPENYTQASLFFGSDRQAHAAVKQLEDLGYTAVPSDTVVKSTSLERMIFIILLFMELVIWLAMMTFIALLVGFVTNKAMMASANDIGILRSMGITGKVIKISIYVQTLIAVIPAYIGMLLFSFLIFRFPVTNGMFTYMYFWQYLIIGIGVLIIAVRISRKYVKNIFKTSVKNTLRGEQQS